MEPNRSAIERAFELARTGLYLEVSEIKERLRNEGYITDHHWTAAQRPTQGPDVGRTKKLMEADFPYIYRWNRCGRKGHPCKVTARGTLNSARVEFEDGFVMVTSRNALKRAPPPLKHGRGSSRAKPQS